MDTLLRTSQPRALNKLTRATALVAFTILSLGINGISPAQATPVCAPNWVDLKTETGQPGTQSVCLGADISITADHLALASAANITFDLNGHSLTIVAEPSFAAIAVPSNSTLTINASGGGLLTVTGGASYVYGGYGAGAGIGGNGGVGSSTLKDGDTNGTVIITGGIINATGGGEGYSSAAGIGGGGGSYGVGGTANTAGAGGGGGALTVFGGFVTASAGVPVAWGTGAAGIGGGSASAAYNNTATSGGVGSIVNIRGGNVIAIGSSTGKTNGPAIGGGGGSYDNDWSATNRYGTGGLGGAVELYATTVGLQPAGIAIPTVAMPSVSGLAVTPTSTPTAGVFAIQTVVSGIASPVTRPRTEISFSYSVALDANGGPVESTQQVNDGSTMTAPTTTRSGYQAPVWHVGSASGAVFDLASPVSAPLELVAVWDAVVVTPTATPAPTTVATQTSVSVGQLAATGSDGARNSFLSAVALLTIFVGLVCVATAIALRRRRS